jgi:hypothetical protein
MLFTPKELAFNKPGILLGQQTAVRLKLDKAECVSTAI